VIPTLQDYIDLGVDAVTMDNLEIMNLAVLTLLNINIETLGELSGRLDSLILAKLKRPSFSDDSEFGVLNINNRINEDKVDLNIILDASESIGDNLTYTFMKNTSGISGVENYEVIGECNNTTVATCEITPDESSAFNSIGLNPLQWARTYFRVSIANSDGESDVSGNRFIEVKRAVAPTDETLPDAKLAVPKFENGDNIPSKNLHDNAIKGTDDKVRNIKLSAEESRDEDDNGDLTIIARYEFLQKTDDEYVTISDCNSSNPVCILKPTAWDSDNWSKTFYKVNVYDIAGNVHLSGDRFVNVYKD